MSQAQMGENHDLQPTHKIHTQTEKNEICFMTKEGWSPEETVREQSEYFPRTGFQKTDVDHNKMQLEINENSVNSIPKPLTSVSKTNSSMQRGQSGSDSPITVHYKQETHLSQLPVNAEDSPQAVQKQERQITLKVLPQNIIIKPTVQIIPTAPFLVNIPIAQNTAIFMGKDGGGQISKPKSTFVEEMVKRSGMKIVDTRTRMVMNRNDTVPETGQRCLVQQEVTGMEGLRPPCTVSISTSKTHTAPSQLTTVPQSTRTQLLPSQRQTLPGVPSPQCMIRPPFALQSFGTNLSPNQTLPVQFVPRHAQINVAQRQPMPRPCGGTVGNFGQSPSVSAPGMNYIKVRLKGLQRGAQWILLPKCYASPKINSPPLPRKQSLLRDVPKSWEDFKTLLDVKQRPAVEGDPSAAIEQEGVPGDEGVGEEAIDTDAASGVECPQSQVHDRTRKDNDVKEMTIINFDTEGTNRGSSQKNMEGKIMQKSSEDITHEKSNHLVESSPSNLQERQDTEVFPSRTLDTAPPVHLTEGSDIIETINEVSSHNKKVGTCNDVTLECLSKNSISSTPHITGNIRIATPTTCTPTLSYASLSPRCKTTNITRPYRADAKNPKESDAGDSCGQAIADYTDSCAPKGMLTGTDRGISCDKDTVGGRAAQSSALDRYRGPVDMYVYLPEKAFREGSITFLSLRK